MWRGLSNARPHVRKRRTRPASDCSYPGTPSLRTSERLPLLPADARNIFRNLARTRKHRATGLSSNLVAPTYLGKDECQFPVRNSFCGNDLLGMTCESVSVYPASVCRTNVLATPPTSLAVKTGGRSVRSTRPWWVSVETCGPWVPFRADRYLLSCLSPQSFSSPVRVLSSPPPAPCLSAGTSRRQIGGHLREGLAYSSSAFERRMIESIAF
jgi:hypothetical protein